MPALFRFPEFLDIAYIFEVANLEFEGPIPMKLLDKIDFKIRSCGTILDFDSYATNYMKINEDIHSMQPTHGETLLLIFKNLTDLYATRMSE